MTEREEFERLSKELDECSSSNDCSECANTSCPAYSNNEED